MIFFKAHSYAIPKLSVMNPNAKNSACLFGRVHSYFEVIA